MSPTRPIRSTRPRSGSDEWHKQDFNRACGACGHRYGNHMSNEQGCLDNAMNGGPECPCNGWVEPKFVPSEPALKDCKCGHNWVTHTAGDHDDTKCALCWNECTQFRSAVLS